MVKQEKKNRATPCIDFIISELFHRNMCYSALDLSQHHLTGKLELLQITSYQ